MNVQVLFFGAASAITGKRQTDMELDDGNRSREVFDQLLADNPGLASHKLFFSINQQYATGEEIVRDGDELAIFTAVSGG